MPCLGLRKMSAVLMIASPLRFECRTAQTPAYANGGRASWSLLRDSPPGWFTVNCISSSPISSWTGLADFLRGNSRNATREIRNEIQRLESAVCRSQEHRFRIVMLVEPSGGSVQAGSNATTTQSVNSRKVSSCDTLVVVESAA